MEDELIGRLITQKTDVINGKQEIYTYKVIDKIDTPEKRAAFREAMKGSEHLKYLSPFSIRACQVIGGASDLYFCGFQETHNTSFRGTCCLLYESEIRENLVKEA